MLIWNGLGFLAIIFCFGAAIMCQLFFDAFFGAGYYSSHKWTIGAAMFIAAALSWITGNSLRKRSDRIVIDKETGEEITINRSIHSLFFIPMHYWGHIFALAGAGLCAYEIILKFRANPF